MELRDHVQTTGTALKHWFIAQTYDSLCVAGLWLLGLFILGVPWAPFWALLAFFLQYIPHFGPVLTLLGPAVAAGISGGWMRLLYVMILYAVIVVIDGFLLQPVIMKRTARVPVWASILTPLILAFTPLGFWGILLAPPALAIIYAYRARLRQSGTNVQQHR